MAACDRILIKHYVEIDAFASKIILFLYTIVYLTYHIQFVKKITCCGRKLNSELKNLIKYNAQELFLFFFLYILSLRSWSIFHFDFFFLSLYVNYIIVSNIYSLIVNSCSIACIYVYLLYTIYSFSNFFYGSFDCNVLSIAQMLHLIPNGFLKNYCYFFFLYPCFLFALDVSD